MQDIPREDFSILNGCDAAGHGTDKDMYQAFIYKIQNSSSFSPPVTNLPKESNNELTSNVPVKLEDISTIELFPSNSSSWQHYQNPDLCDHRSFLDSRHSRELNGTKLLLQGSDDPLISHGANSVQCHDDEYPADFARSLITTAKNHFQETESKRESQTEQQKMPHPPENSHRVVKSGCSNLTRQQLKVKANLMSARNQQYQQSQSSNTPINTPPAGSRSNQKNHRPQKSRNKKTATVKLRFHHQALPPEYLSHYEATQGQQAVSKSPSNYKAANQRCTAKTANSCQKQSQSRSSHENVRSWLQKIAEIQRTANASKESAASHAQKPTEKDNCKPIPVKAYDSQHASNRLPIDNNNNNYKAQKRLETQNISSFKHFSVADDQLLSVMNAKTSNYQQTNYSNLPFMGEITLDNCKPRRGRKPKKADICHLIHKHYGNVLPKKNKVERSNTLTTKNQCSKNDTYEQPLNLCLRDQPNDSYSISSGDDLSETTSSCPTPVGTAFDYVRDSMLASNLNKSLSSINEESNGGKGFISSNKLLTPNEEQEVHPTKTCYNKLSNVNGRYKTLKKDSELPLKIPITSDFFPSQILPSPLDFNLDNVETVPKISAIQSEAPIANIANVNPSPQLIVPQKRKRSAIFIPPLNIENSKNPATEVSICKFKFTGGSKPSLQEKKMISVDAGGNYRYFSGTGDKASRGYEYFPRESLQHTAGLLPGVNCTGQKLCLEMPPTSNSSDNDVSSNCKASTSSTLNSGRSFNVNMDSVGPNTAAGHIEVSKNKACSLTIRKHSSFSSFSPTTLTSHLSMEQLKNNVISPQVKKLSKKEELLKSLKAQGFMIQTQQLESAEDYLPKSNSSVAESTSHTNASEPPTN